MKTSVKISGIKDRKRLILSLFSVIVLFHAGSCHAQEGKLFPQAPGMVSYTYRNSFPISPALTLDTLKSLGITDMEFSSLFGLEPEALRALLDERGMKCSSFGTGYTKLVEQTEEVGRIARILGAEYVRVASIPYDGIFTLDDANKAVSDFNAAGKILKEKFGLTFCYHNHGFEFQPYSESLTLYDYIIQNTDPEYVSFEMDILWVFFPGFDPVEYLTRYPNRFKLMHLKDLRKGVVGNLSGDTDQINDVALGSGQINIPAVLKAAKTSGVEHYYIEDESPLYYLQVPQSIHYLKSL